MLDTPDTLRRVIVTGGAGYIGSHVVLTLLLTRQFKVISIDNHHNSHPLALSYVEKIALDALPPGADRASALVDSNNGDLTKYTDIKAVFDKYGKGRVWGVIHIGAYKAVGESGEIPLTYYQNNVGATVTLLQVMDAFDCTRFVYSSSATVYGIPPVIPIPETSPLQAESCYGRTKIVSEGVISDLCASQPSRWRAISLRYFNPAGAHPSGQIGEDPRGRPGNLLPLLSQMAVGRISDPILQVFGNDYPTRDGTCVRDYLHVMDLAAGHLLALDALQPGELDKSAEGGQDVWSNLGEGDGKFRAFNLGKGRGQSVFDIVEAMRKATGVDFKTEIIGRRLGDVPDLTADPSLAERELGFNAPQTLEVMCRDLWNWQTKNPEGYDTKRD
ncbi:UDP-glucose 4-epimerase [Hysterangium stoloniferum]|nr:UDP-glucose 4-epimerase [Hysterangium stoloniferum]